MMKMITTFGGVLVTAVALQGQIAVRGRVTTPKGEPLEYVNVVAMSLPDSAFISGRKTDAKGEFSFDELPTSSYLVFSSLGYRSVSKPVGREVQVVLEEASEALGGVVITRQRMQMRPGGYTYSFKDSMLPKGKKATELLELLPNLNLGANGELMLLMRKVGVIYLDGVPVRDVKELEAIPAEQIERVEVDYTSSTGEGAEVEGGSLRVYLKKQRDGGYYGNLSAMGEVGPGYGLTRAYGSSYLSARLGRVSMSGTVELGKSLPRADLTYEITNKTAGTVVRTEEEYRNRFSWERYRLNFGYDIAPRHKVVSSVLLFHSVDRPEYKTIDLGSSAKSYRLGRNPEYNLQWFGKYSWQMRERSKLEVSLDYFLRDRQERSVEQTPVTYIPERDARSHMYRLKPVYTLGWESGSKLTIGADAQWVRQSEEVTAGVPPTSARVQKPALYTTFASKVGKLSYSVGARLQHNEMTVRQATEEYRHRHTGLYPSLSMMYAIDQKRGHMLDLTLRHSLGSMPYSAISGYRRYEGPLYYRVGNPSLDAEKRTMGSLMLSLWGKLNLTTTSYYIQRPIYHETRIDPSDGITTYTQPYNGRYMLFSMLHLEGNLNVTKWWHTKTVAAHRMLSADVGEKFSQSDWFFMHTSSFTFDKTSGMRFSAIYEPKMVYLHYKGGSFLTGYGHIYKSFWDDKLEARLDFKLFGHDRSGTMETDAVRRYADTHTKVQTVGLTLTYRFRGGKKVQSVEARPLQSYETVEEARM